MSSSMAWKRLWLILVLAVPATAIVFTSHARGQFPRPIPPRPNVPTIPKVQMPATPKVQFPQFPKPNPVIIPPVQPQPNINMPRPPFGQMAGSDRWICQKCNADLGPSSLPVPSSCFRCNSRMTNAGEVAGGAPPMPVNTPPPAVNVVPKMNPPIVQQPAPMPRTGSSGVWIGVFVVLVGLALIGGVSFVIVRSMAAPKPAKKKKKRYHGEY